jgi:L-2-hydroxyglutarate oxidase LhgO
MIFKQKVKCFYQFCSGSLLVGRSSEQLDTLEEMTKVLSQAGIHAEFLSASALHALEPALSVGKDGGAMFLPQDCQIDAFQAVSLIEKVFFSFRSLILFCNVRC